VIQESNELISHYPKFVPDHSSQGWIHQTTCRSTWWTTTGQMLVKMVKFRIVQYAAARTSSHTHGRKEKLSPLPGETKICFAILRTYCYTVKLHGLCLCQKCGCRWIHMHMHMQHLNLITYHWYDINHWITYHWSHVPFCKVNWKFKTIFWQLMTPNSHNSNT